MQATYQSFCINHFVEVTITGVDLLTEQNQEDHHTDEFECPTFLIARRGSPVTLQVLVRVPSHFTDK